jgi:hypothetical protein
MEVCVSRGSRDIDRREKHKRMFCGQGTCPGSRVEFGGRDHRKLGWRWNKEEEN